MSMESLSNLSIYIHAYMYICIYVYIVYIDIHMYPVQTGDLHCRLPVQVRKTRGEPMEKHL
jgi:hypothetical protein